LQKKKSQNVEDVESEKNLRKTLSNRSLKYQIMILNLQLMKLSEQQNVSAENLLPASVKESQVGKGPAVVNLKLAKRWKTRLS
jgi:hypothetical protein